MLVPYACPCSATQEPLKWVLSAQHDSTYNFAPCPAPPLKLRQLIHLLTTIKKIIISPWYSMTQASREGFVFVWR